MSEVAYAVKVRTNDKCPWQWIGGGGERSYVADYYWERVLFPGRGLAEHCADRFLAKGLYARLVRVTRKTAVTCTRPYYEEGRYGGLIYGRLTALEEAEMVCRSRATSQYGAMAIHLADLIAALRSK